MSQNANIKLEQFLIRHRSKMLTFTVYRVGDENHALDILQEAMMGFVKAVGKYDQAAWLNLFYKILKRRITDFHRKQGWRNRLQQIIPLSQVAQGSQDDGDEKSWDDLHTDDDNTASNIVESQQSANDLANEFELALQALPDRQQEAYLLRQWQGMSVRESADIMGCSEGSVKTHLSRAMQALRKSLGEWIDEK